MTTTTGGDTSSLKTPASLSGGDLVSRLLAATPPYLYNVPLTPHSFFFSEMLRSFVQAKSSSSEGAPASTPSSSANPTGSNLNSRRRKRSWRDARERPLELTNKDNKYFHQQDLSVGEDRYKSTAQTTDNYTEENNKIGLDPLKPVDDNRTDFLKNRHFFDDPSRLFNNNENQGENEGLVGPPQDQERDKNSKLDLKNKNYGVTTTPGTTDFTPSGFWYPPYPLPPQSYPGIDPLHFFIDLRVSGHIWDRKLNSTERLQPMLKSKHCSAFSVPQTVKEYNRPLNLTRDEAGGSSSNLNYRGTHFIFKNLSKTYREIERMNIVEKPDSKNTKNNYQTVGSLSSSSSSSYQDRASPSTLKEDKENKETPSDESYSNKKDIRALIGLELVVDYVKEPKEEPQPQP